MAPDISHLPIIPLAKDSVLIPGSTLRIPVANRDDIRTIFTSVFAKAARPGSSGAQFIVGCVPLNSPLLSPDGKNLLENPSTGNAARTERLDVLPGKASLGDLFRFGTLAKIVNVEGRPTSELYLVVEGSKRFLVERISHNGSFYEADVETYEDPAPDLRDKDFRNTFSQLKQSSQDLLTLLRLSALLHSISSSRFLGYSVLVARRLELYIAKGDLSQAGTLADLMTSVAASRFEEKLQILASFDVRERMERMLEILHNQITEIKGNVQITTTSSTVPPQNSTKIPEDEHSQQVALARRALMARGINTSGMRMLGNGSGDNDDIETNELDELKQKLDDAQLPLEARRVADRELKRLRKMNTANAEYGICRSYLENLAEVPWTRVTEDQLDGDTLRRARKQLDDDHYGLEKIKKRLLEYLAVLKLKQTINKDIDFQIEKLKSDEPTSTKAGGGHVQNDTRLETDANQTQLQVLQARRRADKSPILLLVGPPGTGKTSLAKSVATSLGRKFHRISLGGVRDEAEIRGHRRTYVAAMPGLIVSALKKVGVANPVMLLDEIDKISGNNFHGDPSAAMLEVLDPEQNHSFSDHYINIPIDLSKVLFIATANSLDTIPAPLLDRMETISLSGYTTIEKRHIANRHLIPKQIKTNGLDEGSVQFSDDVVDTIITSYTRESGVRNLEREIGSVCRYKAVHYAETMDANAHEKYVPFVSVDELEDILGIERFDEEIAEKNSRPGIVTGLVAYSTGGQGSILFIEIADMPGSGRVQLTGKLGDVLKESVEVALTWVKAHSYELGLTHDPNEELMKTRNIHVHCPSGAIPKDGPSAGLAHTIALISLFSGRPVNPEIATTGEVSLRGRVMPVGGIKEKLIGAHRAGVKTVLLPEHNRKDVKDVPNEVKNDLQILHVKHIWEAIRHVWPQSPWAIEEQFAGIESRL